MKYKIDYITNCLFISGTTSNSIYSTVISTLSTTDTTCVSTTCTGTLNIKVENITNEDEEQLSKLNHHVQRHPILIVLATVIYVNNMTKTYLLL